MKRNWLKSFTALVLTTASIASLSGCARVSASAEHLTDGIVASENIVTVDIDEKFVSAYTDFSAELFQRSFNGENTAVSPLSMMFALGIVANGAKGDTAEEYARLFGGISAEDMNEYLYSYAAELENEEIQHLTSANSLWLNESLEFDVKREFLQSTVDYYAADVFKGAFSQNTVNEINNWCLKKTDGMIENFIEKLSPDTAALIVNAICFQAAWDREYSDRAVSNGIFTSQNGDVRNATMLSSNEDVYLESSLATGFMKNYEGGRYAFAAILPNEGVTVSELAESLNGDEIRKILTSASEDETVGVSIPEFAYEFKRDMTDVLSDMGLSAAFSNGADYSRITSDVPFYVDGALHMTRIELSREGTRAAAASVIEHRAGIVTKSVELNRPFVYMIVDCENNLPVIIGAVTDIG